MDLAIIIAVHNRNDLRMKNSIWTLLTQNTSYDYGIYVVDYASTDNLESLLETFSSDRIYYVHVDSEPLNKSHANNIAIRAVEADIVCMTGGYCLFQDTLVEALCSKVTEESLLVRVKRPSYVPEYVWQDPSLTPEDFERFRQEGPEWLEKSLDVAPGPKRKRLFAIKRERILEIRGYNEQLAYDEDVDIVRRLLIGGNVLVDVSDDIAMAYQPSVVDFDCAAERGLAQQRDLTKSEGIAALRRHDPRRNLNREWGQI